MKTKIKEFEVLIPNLDGTDIAERIKIPVTLEWDEEVKEWLLTPEAHKVIEETKARRIGLLLPAQMRELRERYGYSQREMGELFQAGEKSWTRWESGKHRPSRSINLIIRALYEGEISINYLLKRAGKPPRDDETFVEKQSPWLSIYAGDEMHDDMASGSMLAFTGAGCGKSTFLKAVLHQRTKQSESPWQALLIGTRSHSLTQDCRHKRFDYQNAKIA